LTKKKLFTKKKKKKKKNTHQSTDVWAQTGLHYFRCLAGRTAEPRFLSQLTFIASHHHDAIQQIDTVRAYHFGEGFLVEIDVVVPPNMLLREAHDVGESLQFKIEKLPQVERCFVHLDYEYTHRPEH
jgi:divalent metal cation (Fe/Co/Zn/Cd) transporter